MWSPIVLCLLVGFTFASTNPGWKDNTEYVYIVRGRTLTSLHEVDHQYSGILLKAKLTVQPRSSDGRLMAKLSDAQYAQVHSHLENGWNTYIPDSQLSYKPLGMTETPFQVEMKYGVIRDLIVDQHVPNWEANIIKSIMSQFQLNTRAINPLYSRMNSLPEGDQNSAVFKTMEETVTGNTETLYEIHPVSEHIFQSEPWTRNFDLKGDGEVIEVVKHKNYSHSVELPSYHFGFAGLKDGKPSANHMGKFFVRSSTGRAILTGTLKRHTVLNSYSVNKIVMSPTLNDKQKGSVFTILNVTLEAAKDKNEKLQDVANPVRLGNLVYSYNSPHAENNDVRTKKPYEGKQYREDMNSEEYERYQRSATMERLRRSVQNEDDSQSSSSNSFESAENYLQGQPQMSAALDAPLLPYFMGYNGRSIKQNKNANIVKTVEQLAKEIAEELEHPAKIMKKNTLSKFVTMTSLARLLNDKELEQIASNLYSNSEKHQQYVAWTVFRDVVAETGTGPAFLAIQNLIVSKKIKEFEAAHIVSTWTNAIRLPTNQLMRSYFDFIKNPEVLNQQILNETTIMSFTNLVRKVYVDKKQSNDQFPVKSFGKFYTQEGKKYVTDHVIPYLSQQLRDAISKADTYKIHTYIRALGNVAHQEILAAFEPYLEGKKQVSQFQRFMMVLSLDKLVETSPEVARSVLYKVYQNTGESQEVRVAAVYQLMRTIPPVDMLERMASYTNVDKHEHVSAAVKSAIESAFELQGIDYEDLRSAAEIAKPLLTQKSFGVQQGMNYLRSYAVRELKLNYKQTILNIGSEDAYIPKGLRYTFRANRGDLNEQIVSADAMVSSIEDLAHMWNMQTADYQQERQQQQQHAQEQLKNKWSSQNIARMLNLKSEEREQLEAALFMELGDIQKMWSFDNNTMKNFPEVVRQFEAEYKNGKEYHHTKLANNREMALSFPTDMGMPFLFTHDSPVLMQVQGTLKASASPKFSKDNKLHKPEFVTLTSNLEVTVSYKTQARLSFSTPFDHQQYVSGFDKNMQVHIPLYGKVEIDVKKGEIKIDMEAKEPHQGSQLFRYGTYPYTSIVDIMQFQPISTHPNTHLIRPRNMRNFDQTFGKKEPGLAVRVEVEHERQFIDLPYLAGLVQKQGLKNTLMTLWDDAEIQYSKIKVSFLPEQSSSRKFIIRMGYQQQYKSQSEAESNQNSADWSQLSKATDSFARQKNLMARVSAGIKSAHVQVYDASIEFQGGKTILYTVTGALGKSNVDPKSRVLIHYWKHSDNSEVKPYEILFHAKSNIPNTNGLDMTYAFEKEPMVDTQIQFSFGSTYESASKIQAQLELRRSNQRKQYLMEHPIYHQAKREMREGNHQLPAGELMTIRANFLDKANIKLQYDNFRPDTLAAVEAMFNKFRATYYPNIEIIRNQESEKENQINFQARFDPDLTSVNVSVKAHGQQSTISNIPVNDWAREMIVVHPVFHLRARLMGKLFGLNTYRQYCVIDKHAANTFDSKTFSAKIGQQWTVMMQHVPKVARQQKQQVSVEEQLKSQTENYVVLVRQNPENNEKKDVKITLSTPRTNFKVIDITLTPTNEQGLKAKVNVNGQDVQINNQQSYDVQENYIQIYALPNGEVKAEVLDAFYIIYDGERIKMTGKFRDSVRGLCGPFNDDQTDDFLTAQNCIARDAQQFIQSFEVEGNQGKQLRDTFERNNKECVVKQSPLYVNVISDRDVRREETSNVLEHSYGKHTKFQTRYVEQNGEICFTLRPVPVCRSTYHQRGAIRKNVAVHCVQKSNIANLWKNQIDKGANPDFSLKKESKRLQMDLPQGCAE